MILYAIHVVGTVWYGMVPLFMRLAMYVTKDGWYDTVLGAAVWYRIIERYWYDVWYGMVWYGTIPYHTNTHDSIGEALEVWGEFSTFLYQFVSYDTSTFYGFDTMHLLGVSTLHGVFSMVLLTKISLELYDIVKYVIFAITTTVRQPKVTRPPRRPGVESHCAHPFLCPPKQVE